MVRQGLRLGCVLLATAALATCSQDENPAAPTGPRDFFATLVSPNTDDAGIVFWLSSPPAGAIDTVVTFCNCELHLRRVSGSAVRGLMIGNLHSSQPTLRITVSGVAKPSHVTVTIKQITGRSGDMRYVHQGYSFTVQ